MKKLSLLIQSILLCGGTVLTAQDAAPLSNRQHTWKLVWKDEFNYRGAPDTAKWGYNTGNNGWGNNEKQNYIRDTSVAKVKKGFLYITANRLINGADTSYTSARLVTKNKGDWKYGRIEIRAKIAKGLGICSAIWMLPTERKYGGWPSCGEIDIMEHVEIGDSKDKIYQTIHTGAYNHVKKTQKGAQVDVKDPSAGFHICAIEWNAEAINYSLDGKPTYSFPNEYKTTEEWPFDIPFHLIMNISVGGKWEGAQGIDPAIFPATMQIDYVRVYQKKI